MYPNLYYFFYDVFGLKISFLKAVNSFGFFVALAFLAALSTYRSELKRKEEEELLPVKNIQKTIGLPASMFDILSNSLLGFLLGFKLIYAIVNSEVFSDFPAFLFSSQGNIIGGLLGAVALGYWRYYEGQKEKLPEPKVIDSTFHSYDHLGTILILAVVFGFLGAKLFAYLENPIPISEFLADPFRGLTMYGGLICAAIAITIYFKRNNLPVLHFYDGAAPGLMLAYGIGRIGCHVSGDGDWGIDNTSPKPGWLSWIPDWAWAYKYPNNVNSSGIPIPGCDYEEKYCNALEVAVYPTPFYEFLMCVALFFVLWYFRKKIKTAGALFMLYLSFNGIERFLIESIRINEPYTFLGIESTQAQLISLTLLFAGLVGFVYLVTRKPKPSV